MNEPIERAAEAIRNADYIWIGAGAGIGVDSGLPDFRGPEGFWRAYPVLKGIPFEEMANPAWFRSDPSRAWGFYGHRLNLYRETIPHQGFSIMKSWIDERKGGFVYTSNVDGQFQKAGFSEEMICECHGSIHWLQDLQPSQSKKIWSADQLVVNVDENELRAQEPLPMREGKIIRPNILMFGDWDWLSGRTEQQQTNMYTWSQEVSSGQLAIIEIGAGTSIPSVRRKSHMLLEQGACLIRINPRESHGPNGTISMAMGGLQGLSLIDEALR